MRLERDLALALAAAEDADSAMDLVAAAALAITGLDASAVYLLGSGRELVLRAHRGLGQGIDGDPLARCVASGDPRFHLVMAGRPFVFDRDHPSPTGKALGFASVAVQPVAGRDGVVGCINVASGSQDRVAEGVQAALADLAGLLGGAMARFHSADARAAAEAALVRERTLLAALVEHLPLGVVIKEVSRERFGTILMWNRASEAMTGVPAQAVIGKSDADFFPAEQAAFFRRIDQQVVDTGLDVDIEEEALDSRTRGRLSLRTRKTLVRSSDGTPLCIMAILEDVTEARRAAEEILRAKESAEVAANAKSQFLAMMSHEIRTPMNGVVGAADLLARSALDPGQRELVSVIRSSGEHLLAVLGDVLDYSAIEGGKLQIAREGYTVASVVAEAVGMLEVRARAKGIGLVSSIDPEVPARLVGDAQRIRQVIVNLVGNAVKFTDRGSVSVAVRSPAGDGPERELVVEVSDTGPGIEPALLPHLFDAFIQGDAGRRSGGTGLGLAISRRLVEAMGGTIHAGNRPGGGAVVAFSVHCPASADSGSSSSEQMVAATARRVLLAEDEAINRMVVTGMLTMLGCTVEAVEDGREAVGRAIAGSFDLVLMDVQMPVMDGLEATRRLRAAGIRTPVIGASANAFTEDRTSAFAAGMDGYLTKPLTMRALAEAMLALPPRAAPG